MSIWAVESSSSENEIEKPKTFNLTVIILTMNRPESLRRALKSIYETDFENEDDFFDVEIHIDKTTGKLWEECIQ